MCGIAGLINPQAGNSAVEEVRAMLRVQSHRGPEGMTIARTGAATFGVCHLRFVDPFGPPQPYRAHERQLLVVFNGEIYNHAELAQYLIDAGHPVGRGEAALLASLYLAEGAQMAKRLNGMFAIAIFDGRQGEAVLIRDQFGKKPLNYMVAGRELRFSSELSGLRSTTDVDPAALCRYLTFNAIPAPASLLRGVRKVEPGSVVRVRGDTVSTEYYWRPRLCPGRHQHTQDPKVLDSALRAATRRRIPSVPFGVFLSGGLDSGLVAVMAARESSSEIRSYSLGFPENPSFDESSKAVRMAAAAGTSHTVVPMPLAELAAAVKRWMGALDEPIADHSLIPTAVLAAVASADVKAVLTGDGADELAMGYELFVASSLLRGLSRAIPAGILSPLLAAVRSWPPSDRNLHPGHVAALLARAITVPPERQYYAAAAAVPFDLLPTLLTADALAASRVQKPYEAIETLVRDSPDATPNERLQLGLICHFLRDVILAKLDRATMLASIEARSPFLDAELVELLLAIPESQKLHRLTGKHIVRQVASRYMPREFVYQRKRGFRAPVAALLRGPLRDWVRDLLATDSLRAAGLFRPEAVSALLAEHLSGQRDHHRQLWSLACFQSWLDAKPLGSVRH